MTDSTAAPTKSPFLNLWDVITAFVLGVVGFIMSVIHQEELWVCFVSGGTLFVLMLFTLPIVHRLRGR